MALQNKTKLYMCKYIWAQSGNNTSYQNAAHMPGLDCKRMQIIRAEFKINKSGLGLIEPLYDGRGPILEITLHRENTRVPRVKG
ncbi:hypothetical protein V6Z11_A05G417500 [Gossypium hirsutum]